MRRETRVGRMRTKDAHRQGGKSINNIQFSPKFGFAFLEQLPRSASFFFLFFDSFKSLKLRAIRF